MDTAKLEQFEICANQPQLDQIDGIKNIDDLFNCLGCFHKQGLGGMFDSDVEPDAKNSSTYAFQLVQGGLSLPDRDYYLTDAFATQRAAYSEHLKKMFGQLGDSPADASKHAATVLEIETDLAKVSRSRVDLRDPIKNYNKVTTPELLTSYTALPWKLYFTDREIPDLPYAIVGQPEFFVAVNKLVKDRPLEDWKTYLRWHVVHGAAPYSHDEAELENFNFFGKVLSGQEQQEPRWKRAAKVIDGSIGEALGQLYVEKYFHQKRVLVWQTLSPT